MVYNKCWYANVVNWAAQQCMQAAVEEVQSLPKYQSSGEVSCHLLLQYMHFWFCFSGSSQMLSMTPLLTCTTTQFLVLLAGFLVTH